MRTINGNLVRFTSLCLVTAAATVAASAHGQTLALGGGSFGPAPAGSIPVATMSLEECTHGLQPGVPYTLPIDPMPAACVDVLGKHMKDTVDATPQQQLHSMYRVDPATWPENLATTKRGDMRSGLLDAFVEADTRVMHNSDVSYGGTMLAFSTPAGGSLIHTMSTQDAIAHRAHPDWDARGTAIGDANNPCGEWVWKGFYDYSRYEDAAAACGTNDECVYQVAYSSYSQAPGIAGRTYLTGKDDGEYFVPIYKIPLVEGFIAKNPFFGVSTAFLRDQQAGLLQDLEMFEMRKNSAFAGKVELQAGPKDYSCAGNFRFRNPTSKYYVNPNTYTAAQDMATLDQDINALRVLLQKKAGYLVHSTPLERMLHPEAEMFANEWDYHKAMHDRQTPLSGEVGKALPEAERRANDERTKTLLDLMEKYALITSLAAYKQMDLSVVVKPVNVIDDAMQRVISPLPDQGRVVPDPFVYRMAVSSMRGDLVSPLQALSLESAGNVVTNQMAVPFRLVTAQPSATVPLTGDYVGVQSPGGVPTAIDSVSAGPVKLPVTLVGAERDYGKAAEVLPASVGNAFSCPNPEQETELNLDRYQLARAAQEVQEQIVALLLDEAKRGANGCLSESGYNCDWSPTLFAQRFQNQFSKARENAFQYCVLMTGGNTLENADPLFRVPDNKRTMAWFPEHLNTVKEILREQLEGLPYRSDGDGDYRVGESTSGGKDLGHGSWFGASYDYTAGWSIIPQFNSTSASATPCAFSGQADAEFNANVSILGHDFRIVHAQSDGQTADGAGSFGMELDFLDETFHPSRKSEHFHQVKTATSPTNKASATVVVVVVPVTFEAFGELEYGYDVEAKMTSNNECASASPSAPNLGVQLRLQPFAKINAVASAGVGVSGAQAGVRGRIALLDAKLPMTASLEVKPDPDVPSSIKLFPTASADMEVGALSGRMSAFAEISYVFGTYTAEKNIFSWGGVHDSIPLFQLDSKPVQLAAFNRGGWVEWIDVNKSVSE